MIKYSLIIGILFWGCNQCGDKNFEISFNQTINKLERLKSNGISQNNNVDSVTVASNVIFTLTTIRPQLSFDYTATYLEKDFKSDSIKWRAWYENNKCKMTRQIFDSVYEKAKLDYKKM